MIFTPFEQQKQFLRSKARITVAAASKRSGKTEIGAIKSIIAAEQQPGFVSNGVDPYIGVIIAPTNDMLRRLSLMKFLAYAKHFKFEMNKSNHEIRWHNGSIVYGLSADRPQRLEGIKASWVWL